MKLYPPIIEGKIPAQSGTELTIPFRFNRSVSPSQVSAIQVKIKTAVSGTEKMLASSTAYGSAAEGDYEVKIDAPELEIGQYYKVQLACVDWSGAIGYYSSIGVFKYTGYPELKILEFEDGQANCYEYVGYYKNEDLTEKVATYCFDIIKKSDNSVYATSGELVHDSSTDELDGTSKDYYELEISLQEGEEYTISYSITTVNGLCPNPVQYTLIAADTLPNPLDGELEATCESASGRVQIAYTGAQWQVGQGYGFVLSRSEEESNYTVWRDVLKFSAAKGSAFPHEIGYDYSIEQGKKYKYALQLYQTSGLRSTRLESDIVLASFDDIFLFDGERQLRVQYNPKVSSFKTAVLESKTDTLGGQYPFFFRNGATSYKEFPISGLLSYLMDENEDFMSFTELGIESKSTDLGDENFKAERQFKTTALEWLNNGKPKLFRSPGEGNFIVRLMNTSATPNDTLGRMLHTFNCQAYEIAECSYKNMVKYGFVSEKKFEDKILYYCSDPITTGWSKSFAENGGAYKAELRDVVSGTLFQVKYANSQAPLTIEVGSTGTYIFNVYDSPIQYVCLAPGETYESTEGWLDYGVYEQATVEDFSEVHSISYSMQPFDFSTPFSHSATDSSLMNCYNSLKLSVGYIYYLRLQAKKVEEIYQNGGKYYSSPLYLYEVEPTSHDTLYHIDGTQRYVDGFSGTSISTLEPDYLAVIEFKDGTKTEVDLSGPQMIIYHSLSTIKNIYIGNGVLIDGMYQQAEYTYGIELTELANLHEQYETAKETKEGYEEALAALNGALAEAGIKGV